MSMANDGIGGLVGGTTYLSSVPLSVKLLVSQISNDANGYLASRNLEDFLGKLPIVHIEDVCQAHIFCMEEHSITGRFMCASSYVAFTELGDCYQKNYLDFHLNQE